MNNILPLIKIFLFIGLLYLAIIILRQPDLPGITIKPPPDKKILYVVGSSRSVDGFDDSIFNRHSRRFYAKNLGLDGTTFLTHYIRSSALLEDTGRKWILMELSIINARMAPQVIDLIPLKRFVTGMKEISAFFTASQKKKIFYPFIEQYITTKLSLRNDLKILIGLGGKDFPPRPRMHDIFQAEVPFPVSSAVKNPLQETNSITRLYDQLIKSLNNKARLTGSTIIYYLPLAFLDAEERSRLLSVFERIPESNKVRFDTVFMRKMNDSRFFWDTSHLNFNGKIELSRYLANRSDEFKE